MRQFAKGPITLPPKNRQAFTLIELLVVMAVVGLLAGMLLPALSKARSASHTAHCLNNLKQQQLAWMLYADDHQGRLVPNNSFWVAHERFYSWVQGRMDYSPSNTQNTNVTLLTDPKLAAFSAYLKSPKIYRCPGDRSAVLVNGQKQSRTRSYSMNMALGYDLMNHGTSGSRPLKFHLNYADISRPSPSKLFVFMEHHPDFASDVHFHMNLEAGTMTDFPASHHNGRGAMSFADGHAEARRWQDPRTRRDVEETAYYNKTVASPDNADAVWLKERFTSFR